MFKDILIVIKNSYGINLLQIFDSNGIKIIDEYVNNKYIFNGKIGSLYKVKIISKNMILNTNIYINEKYDEPYVFSLKKQTIFHEIFIKLIDQNYNDLKIEKGKIKLWTTNMT